MAGDANASTDDLLARGGGNATASGVSFQASLGAVFAIQLLAERQIDERLRLGEAQVISLRFETEAPLDDILIGTSLAGWVFVQAKTTLSLSENLDSEIGKTAEQIVRQWHACASGRGQRGWDRPLDPARDRLLIAVGPGASGTISRDLAMALSALQAASTAPLPSAHQQAVDKFSNLLSQAWQKIIGTTPSAIEIDSILRTVTVLQFDLAGADRTAAVETLRHITEDASTAAGAFDGIATQCEKLAAARRGADASEFRRTLAQVGLKLRAAPSYQADVQSLRDYSARIQSHLIDYEETKVQGVQIKIERDCTSAVVAAAKEGSLVLVGEPGAGKSAVVSAAASKLRTEGCEVIQLAVDRLPVESLEGLGTELGLEHSFRDVLCNWPGADTAYLFLDALDATRGGRSEAVFRALIAEVLDLPDDRWRVIASIRTFDLRLGEQFRNLFKGAPPNAQYVDPAFSKVRHLHIPRWSDDELSEVLAKAPAIGTAIDRGGPRLRELAYVPFNTRLLADMISDGIAAEAFGEVGSQVELLALYWEHRVARHGDGAELCLQRAVSEMVSNRALRARRLNVAQSNPDALTYLLRENVLVTVAGETYVSFRHHLLFDYAASRVFIDLHDVAAANDAFRRERGLGLMLAPALSFALQYLWVHGQNGHSEFWNAVIHFAGDSGSDPVARSIAARAACELPTTVDDVQGLKALLSVTDAQQSLAFQALSHIVGALAVRIEDKQTVSSAPWCHVAFAASQHIQRSAWTVRSLLFLLLERTTATDNRDLLGSAARALLNHALIGGRATQLASAAIGFVADTYGTDPGSSRELLARLLTPDRLRDHAHEDMSWLSRKIKVIGETDPEFVVEIYATIFGHVVDDTSATSMGDSQIMPLTSNKRQDYEMSRWTLKEAFPGFLKSNPLPALRALVKTLENYVASEHRLQEGAQEHVLRIDGQEARLIDDLSHVWAYNPDDDHHDNFQALIKAFTQRLMSAKNEEARQLVAEAIACNRLAVIWARMFLAGAKRPEILGLQLWPCATTETFLRSTDTAKDAIDLIAATYPLVDEASRRSFEQRVMGFAFSEFSDPEASRRRFLLRVFATLGVDQLITAEARELLASVPEERRQQTNRRPFEIITSTGEPERYWWLKRKEVDVDAPANTTLLSLAEDVSNALGLSGKPETGIAPTEALARLQALAQGARDAVSAGANAEVIEYAENTLADGCEKLAQQKEELQRQPEVLASLCNLVEPLLAHPSPHVTPETNDKYKGTMVSTNGVRVDGVEATLQLCQVNSGTANRFVTSLEALVRDPHPAVRLVLAQRLVMLWHTARDAMWRLAEQIARDERHPGVLRFFADFLNRVIHADPVHTEALVIEIMPRVADEVDDSSERLADAIGSLVVLLWVSHGRTKADAVIKIWISDAAAHEAELSHGMSSIRDGLVLGYGASDARDTLIRRRCQELAAQVINATASGMEQYFQTPQENRTEEDQRRATRLAKLLDHTSDQFFFASGAFRRGNADDDKSPLTTDELKRAFLDDNHAVFQRVGDVGTPHTIYHLIELLGFLVPANPPLVFDLVAHALLKAGRDQGYHFESLGADRFVEVIGLFLADHREIFDDNARRDKLVACLDAFVEAGWPAARRLLYRLPELLQ